MKIRSNFVSNSSSSSFIIYNWAKIPDDKKQKILDYKKYVVSEWKQLGVKTVCNKSFIRPMYSDFGQNASPDGICMGSKYDFGYIGDGSDWKFKERKENGILEMATSMDNFAMDKWLDYIGGFDYRWTGDGFGFIYSDGKQGQSQQGE